MGRVNILARSWYLRLGGASVILSVVALLTGPGIRGSLLLLVGGRRVQSGEQTERNRNQLSATQMALER